MAVNATWINFPYSFYKIMSTEWKYWLIFIQMTVADLLGLSARVQFFVKKLGKVSFLLDT